MSDCSTLPGNNVFYVHVSLQLEARVKRHDSAGEVLVRHAAETGVLDQDPECLLQRLKRNTKESREVLTRRVERETRCWVETVNNRRSTTDGYLINAGDVSNAKGDGVNIELVVPKGKLLGVARHPRQTWRKETGKG
ncbi:hypothetical protein EYF80_044044 [Liparis tanakae]|uniref:Uncharacterized protein n=1 Tax=Liparis tanakae TaxID=230148 RepID=A0A4Z2FXQ7_9TELE|nr:hypothetical protein EYF80_044044 [Liparis tanakae]